MLIILIEDGFPVIFFQKRLGLNKDSFFLIKLRTMKINTREAGTHEIDKSFILGSGKILRKLKFDELLQLVNVLKKELNLVGPRPCLENQFDLIEERDSLKVFRVKPGITGLSQVCGFDMSTPSMVAKIDAFYIQNKTLWLDCMLLIATLTGLFRDDLKKKIESI